MSYYAHEPELMSDASWCPATRDMAAKYLAAIRANPEKENELRKEFNQFFLDNPECLF
jgi:hypothetical protein